MAAFESMRDVKQKCFPPSVFGMAFLQMTSQFWRDGSDFKFQIRLLSQWVTFCPIEIVYIIRTITSGVLKPVQSKPIGSFLSLEWYIQSFCWGHVDMLMLNSTRATAFNFEHMCRAPKRFTKSVCCSSPCSIHTLFTDATCPFFESLVETHVTACQARIHINRATSFFLNCARKEFEL